MSDQINKVTRTANVSIQALIKGANVTFDYSVQGNELPSNVRVNANFNSGGASSNSNRNYSKSGDYETKSAVVIQPFDEEYDTVVAGVVAQIFTKFDAPESITV